MKFDLEIFGERLTSLREKKNLTITQLGKALGVGHSAVSRWESAKRAPSVEKIFEISIFFGTSADYLIGLRDN